MLSKVSDDGLNNDIISFLARPVRLSSGTVSSASVVNTTLINIGTNAIMASPQWVGKLSNIYGFTGTLVVRLQTSAQQFQAGILMQSYVPLAASIGPARVNIARSRLSLRRQLPSVVHNIAATDDSIIRIPYVSDENFYRFNVSQEWFTYSLSVYSPIAPSGAVPYTLWAHWENVSLISTVAQSGRGRRTSPTIDEAGLGIISKPLRTFSDAFNDLSRIPLLSSFSITTSWFLAAASNAASAFGFSNPNSLEPQHAMVPKSSSRANNCDVLDNLDSHGLFVSNAVGHLNQFAGTDIDEMSVSYISSIPFVGLTSIWTTAQTTGTLLSSWQLSPRGMFDTFASISTPPVNCFVVAPGSYLLEGASLWRGSICYRVHLAKTEFHTGRLMFVFNPDATVPTTVNNFHILHKVVVDIRDTYCFDFVVPFMSNKLYLPTSGLRQYFGTLSVFIIDPLNAPATVSGSVVLTYEMAMGPDFEFAGLTGSQNLTPIYAQSMAPSKTHTNRMCDDAFNLTGGSITPEPKASLFAAGELITSIRQLLKRSQLFEHFATPIGSSRTAFIRTDPHAIVLPFAVNAGVPITFPPTHLPLDTFSRMAPLFALMRGSMVYRTAVASNPPSATITSLYRHSQSNTRSPILRGTQTIIPGFYPNLIASTTQSQGMLEAHLPYYQPTHSIPVINVTGPWLGGGTNIEYENYTYEVAATIPSGIVGASIDMNLFRQVGEDFSFGLFIGVLPLTAEPNPDIDFN